MAGLEEGPIPPQHHHQVELGQLPRWQLPSIGHGESDRSALERHRHPFERCLLTTVGPSQASDGDVVS